MKSFIELGIQKNLSERLKEMNINEPTNIQVRAIPVILDNKDVIAQAQTGTGKTLAFVLPILELIETEKDDVQALIVTPTRELALQITGEIMKLVTQLNGVNVLAVYGGQDVEQQLKKLKGVNQIVVATPGRLLDHVRRQTIDLSKVSILVLDEADQLLHMGFLPEVEAIQDELPEKKQTLLFSATMPKEVRSLAKRFMKKATDIKVQSENITVEKIKQIVYETTDRSKQDTLCHLIDQFRPFLAIIFCRTKRRAKTLNEALQSRGYLSDELHGDLSQSKREKVVERFKNAKLQLLVATDVAARGLDIEGVTHVFNYDIPHDVESYIHRIGRTGRAGYEGMAITLVAPKDNQYLQMIEKGIQIPLKRKRITVEKEKQEIHQKKYQNPKSYKNVKKESYSGMSKIKKRKK